MLTSHEITSLVQAARVTGSAITLYLAGPMRGYPLFNFPAFADACRVLREAGYVVVSPHEHDLDNGFDPSKGSLEDFDLAAAMRWDLTQVLDVDGVAVLRGWEASSGAGLETDVADAIGTPVGLVHDWALAAARAA